MKTAVKLGCTLVPWFFLALLVGTSPAASEEPSSTAPLYRTPPEPLAALIDAPPLAF
ncbi:MAG: hypothetical protein HC897_18050, partial [Thermoanaerobaculia bacterium]|nr:hypothetical protein [Thermoanaerobaculia bacterium]